MASKKTIKKKTAPIKSPVKIAPSKSIEIEIKKPEAQHFNAWSLSIYIYWFIILFFISATFYILGRSHSFMNPAINSALTEESLKSENGYNVSGKEKLMSGKLDEAIADFNVALSAENPSADTFVLRGQAYMQAGDYKSAMADFDNAIKLDPTNSNAYYDRSLLKSRLEDFSGALTDINNALAASAVKPNDSLSLRDIYAKRGQLNLWLKNYQGAVADYTNSLSRTEGSIDASAYADRAEAYTALNNYTAAIADYGSAVRVISEQIQGVKNQEQIEDLSRRAMSYFEKSAALNIRTNNMAAAKQDLESAYTIATGLNDTENASRLKTLIGGIK